MKASPVHRCSRCGSDGPFYRDRSRASGWAPKCKKCSQEISAAYRLAHPEWAAKERARRKQWSLEHLERDRARWREKGRARKGPAERAKQISDPELREKALEKRRNYTRERRRLLAASGNAITPEQWAETLIVWGGACAYCLRTDAELYKDHVIALSRGGENTPENVVPSCNSCNGRKAHHPVFWMAGKPARTLVIPRRAAPIAGQNECDFTDAGTFIGIEVKVAGNRTAKERAEVQAPLREEIERLAVWLSEECYRVAQRYYAALARRRPTKSARQQSDDEEVRAEARELVAELLDAADRADAMEAMMRADEARRGEA